MTDMTHEFEVREEIELAATPEQVWDAITTGPGVDSWLMGSTRIEAGVGGRTSMTMMGFTQHGTVTAWEPGKQFAFREDVAPDGTFMAVEYLIEGRDGGSTVLRFVHSGLLGDDWQDQYDGLSIGDRMYLCKLAAFLKHFGGRVSAHNMFAVGPQVADTARVWPAFGQACGLTGAAGWARRRGWRSTACPPWTAPSNSCGNRIFSVCVPTPACTC
jgi:uncharacterized protein YndB with AHSA1/START domain